MLYRYCRTDGFDIINNSRLRLSRIDRLNDPFELVYAIDEDSAYLNLKNEYTQDPTIITIWRATLDDQGILYDAALSEDILVKFTEFQIADFRRVRDNSQRNLESEHGSGMPIRSYERDPNVGALY